jgi:hypothetical protein
VVQRSQLKVSAGTEQISGCIHCSCSTQRTGTSPAGRWRGTRRLAPRPGRSTPLLTEEKKFAWIQDGVSLGIRSRQGPLPHL